MTMPLKDPAIGLRLMGIPKMEDVLGDIVPMRTYPRLV